MRLARHFALLLCAVLAAPQVAADSPAKIRFQLDWRIDGQTAPFFLANCKGYYKQEGLDVQLDAGAGSALSVQRVASGTYDMGFGDTSSLIEFVANNLDNPALSVRAVYVTYDATPAGVMALKRSGIGKPIDLVGKTLGAPTFDAGRKLWPLFARAQGIDPTKVKWQTMEPRLREPMLARGDLDAITGFPASSVISLNEAGVKDEEILVFNYKDFGVSVYGNAVLANERFLKDQPKAVAAFLRAYNRALKDVIAQPEEAIRCLKQREPIIDEKVELKRLKAMVDNYVVTPGAKADGLGSFNQARLDAQVIDVVAAFNLKQRPDTGRLFDASFLPAWPDRQIR
jgi:NitT/TauT family transport system substrate-binding protein